MCVKCKCAYNKIEWTKRNREYGYFRNCQLGWINSFKVFNHIHLPICLVSLYKWSHTKHIFSTLALSFTLLHDDNINILIRSKKLKISQNSPIFWIAIPEPFRKRITRNFQLRYLQKSKYSIFHKSEFLKNRKIFTRWFWYAVTAVNAVSANANVLKLSVQCSSVEVFKFFGGR